MVEVFRCPEDYALLDEDGTPAIPGWYFWYLQPGCLPDFDPVGPFYTEADAWSDADRIESEEDGE